MFQVTWIFGGLLYTVTTPNRFVARMVHAAMRRQFKAVRLWYKNKLFN